MTSTLSWVASELRKLLIGIFPLSSIALSSNQEIVFVEGNQITLEEAKEIISCGKNPSACIMNATKRNQVCSQFTLNLNHANFQGDFKLLSDTALMLSVTNIWGSGLGLNIALQ
jgi:hypothetical protein